MHEITTETATATVVMPEIGQGTPVATPPAARSGEAGRAATPGQAPDTEPIAQAVVNYLQGKSAEALRILLAAAEECKTPDVLASLGYVQTELGQHGPAAETYAELSRQKPEMAESWFQWGFNLYKLGRTEEALEQFDKAANLRSDWIETPLARAICHLKLKHYPEALEHIAQCLAMDPAYKPALFAKAVVFHIQWEFEPAFELYRRIVEELDVKCIEALLNLITLGLQQKKYDIVRKYAEQLVELQPDVSLAVEGIAIAAFHEGDFERAWQQYTRLIELSPDQVAHWLNLGVTCERRNMLQDAVRAFTKACQLRPDSLNARSYLGGALWKAGLLALARVSYEDAVSRWPEREDFTLCLAQILESLGNLERAERVCVDFCERDAEKRQVWFRLGYIQFKRGRWEEAIRSFARALILKSDWPDAEVDLGLALHKAGQYDRAETVLLGLLNREPEHLDALKGLATVTLSQGCHERSLELHEKLLELAGPDPDIYYNCGVLSQNLSDANRAVGYYRRSVELRPQFAEALLNLGHALSDLGNREEALSVWISAVELKPDFARGFFRRT